MSDTIFALASALGRAAVAVWRISGPGTASAVATLTGREPPEARRAVVRRVLHPTTGTLIDRAVVLWMPGPASFTGEDSAEFQTHGGRAVAEAVAGALAALPGLRSADPGEFSRRAFLNGRLDLTEAEALADLAAAETEAQRAQALEQAEGGLARLYESWREELIGARSHLEADLEFPDEHLHDPAAEVRPAIATLRGEIAAHLADARRGERLRDGVMVAVIGAPNAGKSSLVNALTGRDVAIVSPEAGTTRDVIEAHLDLGGYPVTVADTAGLRLAEGAIEGEGIARARRRAEGADIVLALFDSARPADPETAALVDSRTIVVNTKADLGGTLGSDGGIRISALSGAGLDDLLEILVARVKSLVGEVGMPPPTRARHREGLEHCLNALAAAEADIPPELVAEELRHAADALGRISGRIDFEELLDRLFRDFCIGK